MDSASTSHPVINVSPFAAMLRDSLVPSAAVGVVCAVVFAVLNGVAGGVSSLFGTVLALAFFASGLLVLRTLRTLSPVAIMAAAMAVFFAQVIVLGVVLVLATKVESLDGPATGITVAIVVVAWQIFQVRSFMRTRQHVYDPDASGASTTSGGSQ